MIQIFGNKKDFDTKKAERYFKERGIAFQSIDMKEKGMSRGEFDSVCRSVGGLGQMLDENCKDRELVTLVKYLSDDQKADKVFENQKLIRTPVVRNGKAATVGYVPDEWKDWK